VPLARWHGAALGAWLVGIVVLRGVAAGYPSDADDRRLAARIADFGLAKIDELAFVDSNPRYGLMLYLNATVETLDLDTDPHADSRMQDVADELKENEGCRVLLVARTRADELARELESDQGKILRLGEAGGYVGFTVDDGSCRKR
jgi:hypothetical protein